jgi:hypothetical protein
MNSVMNDEQPQPQILKPWLAQEVIWLLGSLLGGLLILPAVIYVVGSRMFGPYKGSDASIGISAFYSDFAHDLASTHLSALIIAFGPVVIVYLLRLSLGMLPIDLTMLRKLLGKKADEEPPSIDSSIP